MRDFSKVSPAIWQSKKFRDLANDGQRLLCLYLMTSPHQTSAGCCFLPPGYACADLGWQQPAYTEALAGLEAANLIRTDLSTNEVLIVGWFSINAPSNPKHKTGTDRIIETIRSPILRKAATDALEEVWHEAVVRAEDRFGVRRAPEQRSMLMPIDGKSRGK